MIVKIGYKSYDKKIAMVLKKFISMVKAFNRNHDVAKVWNIISAYLVFIFP